MNEILEYKGYMIYSHQKTSAQTVADKFYSVTKPLQNGTEYFNTLSECKEYIDMSKKTNQPPKEVNMGIGGKGAQIKAGDFVELLQDGFYKDIKAGEKAFVKSIDLSACQLVSFNNHELDMQYIKHLKKIGKGETKTQYHLLLNCPNALESVAKVMQNGNEKGRTELDWKERTKEYFKEKAIRHIFEAETNEIDEDGESHYSHAIANLLFMLELK